MGELLPLLAKREGTRPEILLGAQKVLFGGSLPRSWLTSATASVQALEQLLGCLCCPTDLSSAVFENVTGCDLEASLGSEFSLRCPVGTESFCPPQCSSILGRCRRSKQNTGSLHRHAVFPKGV